MCGQTAERFDVAEGGTTVLAKWIRLFTVTFLSCSDDAA